MFVSVFLSSCGADPKPVEVPKSTVAKPEPTPPAIPQLNSTESPEELNRKIRNLKPSNHTPTEPVEIKKVNLSPTLNLAMIAKGKKTFANNCKSCHSLTGAKGPKASSLAEVLKKRSPAWFINMTTAVPKKMGDSAQEEARLNKCPTRNYDTRLSFIDSRDLLELLLSLK